MGTEAFWLLTVKSKLSGKEFHTVPLDFHIYFLEIGIVYLCWSLTMGWDIIQIQRFQTVSYSTYFKNVGSKGELTITEMQALLKMHAFLYHDYKKKKIHGKVPIYSQNSIYAILSFLNNIIYKGQLVKNIILRENRPFINSTLFKNVRKLNTSVVDYNHRWRMGGGGFDPQLWLCATWPRMPSGYNNSIPIPHIKAVPEPPWCAELECCYCCNQMACAAKLRTNITEDRP